MIRQHAVGLLCREDQTSFQGTEEVGLYKDHGGCHMAYRGCKYTGSVSLSIQVPVSPGIPNPFKMIILSHYMMELGFKCA